MIGNADNDKQVLVHGNRPPNFKKRGRFVGSYRMHDVCRFRHEERMHTCPDCPGFFYVPHQSRTVADGLPYPLE